MASAAVAKTVFAPGQGHARRGELLAAPLLPEAAADGRLCCRRVGRRPVRSDWGQALQAIAKAPSVPLDLRKAFGLVVAGSGDSLQSQVGNDLILIPGLRALLPPYEGQSVRLYRGDSARNRKRRTYGLSWSTDQAVAES